MLVISILSFFFTFWPVTRQLSYLSLPPQISFIVILFQSVYVCMNSIADSERL